MQDVRRLENPGRTGSRADVVLTSAVVALLLIAGFSKGQQGNEKTFSTPGDAAWALYKAAKSNDSQSMNSIFGSNANEILHTGDAGADKNMVENFLRRYEQMHRVVVEPDHTATLYIGAENWPFPISIVKNKPVPGISTRRLARRRFFNGV